MRIGSMLLALAFAGVAGAVPLSTAFTYQGELFEDGQPLNGIVDLRFTPYADGSNPTLLGPPVVIEDVLVSAGVFTAQVDFGPDFFVGDAVFLEVAVREGDDADPNGFEALTPRQEITAAPYTLRPAPGSVTDIELAGDAVGSAQIADSAVGSADVADGSLTPQDLALAGQGFDATFWRVGGNTVGAPSLLGVFDAGQSLNLWAPSGVTVNGSRFNSNTELTLRGNPDTPETNVDLSLWPRGAEAYFNLGAIGQTSADMRFVMHAVGLNPFTGYDPVLQLDFDGSLGIGGNNPAPQARLHVSRVDLGFDAPADSSESMELVIEDADAQMGLYSNNQGGFGSVIGLAEMNAGALVNQWGIQRGTSTTGSQLQFSFGTATAAATNPVLARFGPAGSLSLNGQPATPETELQVNGQSATPGGTADFAMMPQGAQALFNFSASGTTIADALLTLQVDGSIYDFEPRARFAANGSVGLGRFVSLSQASSFVFADGSSATVVAPSAANQFLVRATGGAALNGLPDAGDVELTVHANSNSGPADIALRPGSNAGGYRLSGRGSSQTLFFVTSDPGGANDQMIRMILDNQGRLLVNPATGPNAFQPSAVPLRVGTAGDNNGNSAFLSSGGTWTNGSSRAFKEAFTAIDAQDVLARVLALPVTRWQYRGGGGGWHLGPMAEDFAAAFGLGEDARYIGTVDADGVALAAIKGLAERSDDRAAALARENAALREALAALAARVEALERGE